MVAVRNAVGEDEHIMDINGNTLVAFRADLKAALVPLQDKYGVTISFGRITYSEQQFSGKLTVVNGQDAPSIQGTICRWPSRSY